MALARDEHVAVGDQPLVLGATHVGQVAEREVDPVLLEGRQHVVEWQLRGLDAQPRRVCAEMLHQHRQKLALAEIAHVQREAAFGGERVEAIGFVERGFDDRQRRLDRACEMMRPRRRHHAAGCAHEQRVFQLQPQPRQAVADRGLREADLLGRAPHVARHVDGAEDAQQVQVELSLSHAV